MPTVHRSLVSVKSKRKILGVYLFAMALQSVQASAQNGTTTGFAWLHMPVGATKRARLRRLELVPTMVTEVDHLTAPRVVLTRFTFTGTASGGVVNPAKARSDHAANAASLLTAPTGLTVTLDKDAWAALIPALLLTTSGQVFASGERQVLAPTDEDEFIDLAAAEGAALYQPDAGTASDGRRFAPVGAWDEYTPADATESSVTLPDDATNTGKSSGTIAEI